ncbi:MAG: NTP transferase domain-containing protein [Chloroflexi bacterium]|jgi:glucose-1-phosphate thymidylyltransferase|nr:NTP transferase domain-containing protein [Chloroflexota bacterium]
MRVIMPMAGYGKRMRPLTWSRPKPLLYVAGDTVLGHTLRKFSSLDIDELVFITGYLGDRIEAYVRERYPLPTRFYEQTELRGQSHAVYLARESLSGPCMLLFVDTLFDADLTQLRDVDADGVIFTMEVDDPRPFGVVVEEKGRITRYIEKPTDLTYRKTTVGAFWVREGAELASAIEEEMRRDLRRNNEYYLADAFNIMIERGARFVSLPVTMWEDCGQPATLLHTNRYLLEHGHANTKRLQENAITPPVYVHPLASVERSIIGPNVTIARGAVVTDSIVSDSIIDEDAHIRGAIVTGSLVGQRAVVEGAALCVVLGDDSSVLSYSRNGASA